ncbi:MAG: hypothetical protein IKM82_00105 [Oscillospiraceae bacterium]|nr:hypothetical protein [Oscillospiraceae bacterium]MBR7073702.1 hypothetical protein [Oscillospiraceae bacterium]
MHKEKKSRGHKIIVLLLLSVILLLSAIACALSLRLYRRSDPALAGHWRMELNPADSACAGASLWLSGARLSDRVDIREHMPVLSVHVDLRLNEDGSWNRSVDEASLNEAERKAEGALRDTLRELARLRVLDAGRPVGTDAELDTRLADAAGMPVDDYLAQYGPRLLPTADALRGLYEGSGSYQIDGVHLRFDGLDDARYLADDALLVLEFVDRTEVYRRA